MTAQLKKLPIKSKDLSEFCCMIRAREKSTTREFAKLLGVTNGLVTQVENGYYKLPLGYLKALTKFLTTSEQEHLLDLLYVRIKEELES